MTQGKIAGVSKINPHLPKNIILAHQAGDNPINQLISQPNDQNGSTYFYDSVVRIRKAGETNG